MIRLRETLQELKSHRVSASRTSGLTATAASYANAVSLSPIDFGTSTSTVTSAEEVNTAPTSFTKFGPNVVGSTVTAPWSGPLSTAKATVGGTYDGSNGTDTLRFEVDKEGIHGEDDLKLEVYTSDGTKIAQIEIKKEDPLNKEYTLANGLSITLGAGEIFKPEEFTVDLSLLSTSFTPSEPPWEGSTANPTIGGTYDGSNGTGELTFHVEKGGTHGVDDLKIEVYAPDNSEIETLEIKKEDPINQTYTLSNGLTLTLSAGDLIKHETFTVNVDDTDPSATTPTQPQWIVSSANPTIGGTYDGSNGTGNLTFRVEKDGTHGVDDLKFDVYASDGSFLEDIDIKKEDPINSVYNLENGLTLTLGAGDLIEDETFTIELEAATTFTTEPNPLESTSEVTIGGVYDGSQATDVLSFHVTQGGTHGTDPLALDVYTSDDTLIDTISIGALDPIDQVYTLSNGLTFQAGTGTLIENETFIVSVNDQIGSRVDPDKQFNGTRNDNPNFDIGLGVTAGSFDVNGTTITVNANDTLTSVLDRITQSAADVTATFNAGSETVLLSHNSPGPNELIVLDNDSSGFLAATKLANAIPVSSGPDSTTSIGEIDSLASVMSGTLTINGTAISLDVATDSLDEVVARINSSAADVTAGFDTGTNRFSITANETVDLVLSSGDTGFFEAVSIVPGVYESTPTQSGGSDSSSLTHRNRLKIARLLEKAADSFNKLFEISPSSPTSDQSLASLRRNLGKEIAASFETSGPVYETGLGIRFDFSGKSKELFRFSSKNHDELVSRLRTTKGVREYRDLLLGDSQKKDGLVDRLLNVTKEAQRELTLEFGAVGIFVDTVV